jgi:hypothetical protein
MGCKSNTAFSTTTGRILAELLVTHIARTEPLQNWDECIEEVHERLCHIGDKKLNMPFSAILTAEVKEKLKRKMANGRYHVAIKEEMA